MPVRKALRCRDQSRGRTELGGTFLNDNGEDSLRVPGNRSGVLERFGPGAGRGAFDGIWSYGHVVLPASTVSTVPVILLDLQLSRNSTAFATSSTEASRRKELRRTTRSRCSSLIARVMSVSMKPGATALTLIPMRPTSRASERVKPTRDAFVAPYTDRPLYPTEAMMEAMFTILPPPSAIMERTTYFVRIIGESEFTRTSSSIWPSRMSEREESWLIPALLTSP